MSAPPAYPLPPPDAEATGLAEPAADALAPPIDHPLHMLGQLLTLVYRLQSEVHEHLAADSERRAELAALLQAHTEDELPRFRSIQHRLNSLTVIVLATGAFAVAGVDGLRQLAGWASGERGIGADGVVTLAGLAAPALYWARRLLFLNVLPSDNKRRGNDDPGK